MTILKPFFQGLLDSLKGVYFLLNYYNRRNDFRELKQRSTTTTTTTNEIAHRLLTRVLQCCVLNGLVFGCSILFFKCLLLPFVQHLSTLLLFSSSTSFSSWLHFLLQWTFDSLWVLPLFVLSRVVNALWFQDIGTLAYKYSQGRPKKTINFSTFIADTLFSLIIQSLFLVQATTLFYLPQILLQKIFSNFIPSTLSTLLYTLHLSLLYSLYSFEYKWVLMAVPLHTRLIYIESNAAYFFGFGLPLSFVTLYFDIVIGGCLFAVLFPLFIVAANEAVLKNNGGGRRIEIFRFCVFVSNKVVR